MHVEMCAIYTSYGDLLLIGFKDSDLFGRV